MLSMKFSKQSYGKVQLSYTENLCTHSENCRWLPHERMAIGVTVFLRIKLKIDAKIMVFVRGARVHYHFNACIHVTG